MWYIGNIPIVESNQAIIVAGFFFSTLAFITISMRIYTRAVLVKNVGIDDVLVVVAYVGSLSYLISSIQQMRFGLGQKGIPKELAKFLISLYVTIISYNFTQMAVKFSILFQYRRIFQTQLAKRLTLILLCWFSLYGVQCIMTSILLCIPVYKFWNPSPAFPGKCMDQFTLHFTQAVFNMFHDIVLFIFPIPFLRNVNVNRRVKAAIIGVFACGFFTCIVAVFRVHSLWASAASFHEDRPDLTSNVTLWGCLEINVAMICASVPALKAFFAKFVPALLRSSLASSKRSGNRDNCHSGYWHAHAHAHGSSSVQEVLGTETPKSSHSDAVSTRTGASTNRLHLKLPWTTATAIAESPVSDLSDDVEKGFGNGERESPSGGGGGGSSKVSPVSGRGEGKMEIMVHRTFETMTIQTPEEIQDKGAWFDE